MVYNPLHCSQPNGVIDDRCQSSRVRQEDSQPGSGATGSIGREQERSTYNHTGYDSPLGFTAVELGLGVSTPQTAKTKPVKTKLPPKYANPANPEKTWAGGKGARPLWVQAHLAAGKPLDDLLIK